MAGCTFNYHIRSSLGSSQQKTNCRLLQSYCRMTKYNMPLLSLIICYCIAYGMCLVVWFVFNTSRAYYKSNCSEWWRLLYNSIISFYTLFIICIISIRARARTHSNWSIQFLFCFVTYGFRRPLNVTSTIRWCFFVQIVDICARFQYTMTKVRFFFICAAII